MIYGSLDNVLQQSGLLSWVKEKIKKRRTK
jgi:hypothetical protein